MDTPAEPDAGRSRSGASEAAPSDLAVRWGARLGPLLLSGLGSTLRYDVRGLEELRAARAGSPDGRVIFCCWHGSFLPLVHLVRGLGLGVLVSRHRDGEIAAGGLGRLGFRPIRGSTRRGGARALLQAMRAAREGDVALTPDGPRGPRGSFGPGPVFLAQRSGLPLIPVGCAARPAWRASSWDRFLVPVPFARVCVVVGPALKVPRDAGREARDRLRSSAEQALAAAGRAAEEGLSGPAHGADAETVRGSGAGAP